MTQAFYEKAGVRVFPSYREAKNCVDQVWYDDPGPSGYYRPYRNYFVSDKEDQEGKFYFLDKWEGKSSRIVSIWERAKRDPEKLQEGIQNLRKRAQKDPWWENRNEMKYVLRMVPLGAFVGGFSGIIIGASLTAIDVLLYNHVIDYSMSLDMISILGGIGTGSLAVFFGFCAVLDVIEKDRIWGAQDRQEAYREYWEWKAALNIHEALVQSGPSPSISINGVIP